MRNYKRGIVLPIAIAVIAVLSIGYYVFTREGAPLQAPVNVGGCEKGDDKCGSYETANWKTYTNTQYGFEFQYPPDWKMENGSTDTFLFTSPEWDRIIVSPLGNGIRSTLPLDRQLEIKNVEVGDKGGKWRRFGDIGGTDSVHVDQLLAISQYPNFTIEILPVNAKQYLSPINSDQFYRFQLILSTFRFTTPVVSTDTANWQTYINTQYGFEIKYPSEWRMTIDQGNVFNFGVADQNVAFSIAAISKQIWEKNKDTDEPHPFVMAANNDVVFVRSGPQDCTALSCPLIDQASTIFSTFRLTSPVLSADTASWKTYVNAQYNFEFKYPSQYFLQENDSRIYITAPGVNLDQEHPALVVSVEPNPNRLDLRSYYSDLYQRTTGAPTSISVGNLPAFKFVPYITFAGETIVIVPRTAYFVNFTDFGDTFQPNGLFDKILSTLRFVP